VGGVALPSRVIELRRRVRTLGGVNRPAVVGHPRVRFPVDRAYISDPTARNDLLGAIERAPQVLPVGIALRVLRVSSFPLQFPGFRRSTAAASRTASSARSRPQISSHQTRLLRSDKWFTAERYRHVPTGRLAVLRNDSGNVFASPATWYRLGARSWLETAENSHASNQSEGRCTSRQAG